MTANQIAYWGLQETKRHNQETEKEAARSNKAKEYETNRSNLVNEGIKRDDVESQIDRRSAQTTVDQVNMITSGVKNLASAWKDVSNSVLFI